MPSLAQKSNKFWCQNLSGKFSRIAPYSEDIRFKCPRYMGQPWCEHLVPKLYAVKFPTNNIATTFDLSSL